MATPDANPGSTASRDEQARAVVLRALAVLLAGLVAYACWRGYRSPDFLLGIGAAFGLC